MATDPGRTPEGAPRREAGALNCPQCGAGVPAKATTCPFCTVKLATIACPGCFGMVFLGSHHCQHCGAKVQEPRPREGAAWKCPRACGNLRAMVLGHTNFDECPVCGGLWLEAGIFEQLTVKQEQEAPFVVATMGRSSTRGEARTETVRYAPCPECRKLMNRSNFAKSSGVIIDVCTEHGVWFDADELRRVITFIRAGGIDAARARESRYLEEKRRADLFRARIGTTGPLLNPDDKRGEGEASGWAAQLVSLFTS